MQAQRACIELAASLVSELDGPVLELGLGQGRTFDHLQETFPNRKVYLIDDMMKPADGIRLDPSLAIKGDVLDLLAHFARDHGPAFTVVHSDLGGSRWDDLTPDIPVIKCLSKWLPQITLPGAAIISNLPIESNLLIENDLPIGIRKGKIFFYRRSSR